MYALGKRLARVDGTVGDPEAAVYFYHTDHLGSVRAVSNRAGEAVWAADYLAFGTKFGDPGNTGFEEKNGLSARNMIRIPGCLTLTGGMTVS